MEKKNILIVANWKSNPETIKEAEKLAKSTALIQKQKGVNVVICPPLPFIIPVKKNISRGMTIGTQDVGMFGTGAHTGDVSISMLRDLKVQYVIVGHSERRANGETDSTISKKIIQCLGGRVMPVLCIGEISRDESHQYLSFVAEQLKNSLSGVPKSKITSVVIAYEPVWAISTNIGTGRDATADEFREMAIYIRKLLSDSYGESVGKSVKIIYGGSVNPKNARAFLQNGMADGLLVGHDSLDSEKFEKIIKIAGEI